MLRKILKNITFILVSTLLITYCSQGNNSDEPTLSGNNLENKSSSSNARNDGGGHVMLQAFHWDSARVGGWYNNLTNNASKLKDAGITLIWSPPPWNDESEWGTGAGTWGGASGGGGEGYFWCNFNLNSKYGSESDLNTMISTMGSNSIKVIIDVVANHADRGNPNSQWDYYSNRWQSVAGTEWGYQFSSDSEIHTGNAYNDIKDALLTLTGKGVIGWRYDVANGYPSGRQLGWNQDTSSAFSVGEFDWSGSWGGVQLEDWCDDTECTGFDWYAKWNFNSANAATFGGLCTNDRAEARSRAVTFVENHDSQASRGNGIAAPDDSMGARSKCYAFMLVAPGTPCIYWTDLMEGGVGYDWLKDMIWVRRNAGIKADSEILYNQTDGGSGRAIIVQGTTHNVALSLDWPSWTPEGSGWTKNDAASGWNGYMNVWTGAGGSSTTGTVVYAHYDVGWGNELYIRGDTSPLNWNSGIKMTNVNSNTWKWETSSIPAGQKFECKVLINDSQWAYNSNWWVYGNETIDIYPNF